MDERHPASGYAPTDEYDPTIDEFVSKERNYIHFDLPLTEAERQRFAVSPTDMAQHAFWPLLGYTQLQRRVRIGETGNRYFEVKEREIKFGSHRDAALLEYYARLLSRRYEDFLSSKPFHGSILAYRTGVGDNVTQARDLISEIKSRGNAIAIAMDIKGFFDNISHATLLSALQSVLGAERLPAHDFKIFTRMTKFEWVEVGKLQERLGRQQPVGGRLCTPLEFRHQVRKKGSSIVEVNPNAFGIPQGTPLSGLYANISMLEFDRIMYHYVRKRGGSYRRYSDDVAIVLPIDGDVTLICKHVERQLKRFGLRLNPDKTEVSVFRALGSAQSVDRPFQYLGFTFDGSRILIRPSSLNRYYRKMSRGVRAKVRAAFEKGVPRDEIYMRELFRRYTHFGKSRNFPRYAYRAAEVLGAPEIRSQLNGHMSKFKRAVRKHIEQVYGR